MYATSFPLQTRWIPPQGNRIYLGRHHRGECRLSVESGLHCASQLFAGFWGKKTYVVFVLFVCSKSGNVHRSFRSATWCLASYQLSALMTQGGHEMTVSRRRGMLGRPEDGEAFEHGYLLIRHLSVIRQCENSTLHTAENSSVGIWV